MSEEDIKRIEKKVDLLYKILLDLEVDSVGHPYNYTYISNFFDDLIPLFNLSANKNIIKIPNEQEVKKSEDNLKDELEKLKRDYNEGNYIAKEKGKLEVEMEKIQDKIEELSNITRHRKDVVNLNEDINKVLLFQSLKNRFGLKQKYPYTLVISNDLLKFLHSVDLKILFEGDVDIRLISTD